MSTTTQLEPEIEAWIADVLSTFEADEREVERIECSDPDARRAAVIARLVSYTSTGMHATPDAGQEPLRGLRAALLVLGVQESQPAWGLLRALQGAGSDPVTREQALGVLDVVYRILGIARGDKRRGYSYAAFMLALPTGAEKPLTDAERDDMSGP